MFAISGSYEAAPDTPGDMDSTPPNAACDTAESHIMEQASRDLALRINYCCFVIFWIVGFVALLIFVLFIELHTPTDILSEV